MKDGAARAFVAFADRRRWLLLAAGLAAAALGALGTARLYADLRPDLTELLPKGARSARDVDAVAARLGGWAEEEVVLHGAGKEALERFADALDARLEQQQGLVASVEYRVDDVARFYAARRWLMPDLATLTALRDRLAARIRWEKAHANPLFVPLDDEPAPTFGDLEARARASAAGGGLLDRFPDGYFVHEIDGARPGEKLLALVLIVRMEGSPQDYGRVARVDRAVRDTVAALQPARFAPGLRADYGGYVASGVLEHDALAEDLVLASLLVFLAVALAMGLYYRTWKAIPAVGAPLLVGALATFGVADLAVGHLNSNTAFLGSIVIGNGINVGLILFARYLEERRRGEAPLPAMQTAVERTWLATLTAALAAGVSYASLLATDFRGFRQFGLIGGVGMAACWLATYALVPPLALAWERFAPLAKPRVVRAVVMERLAALTERRAGAILAAAAVLLALAGAAIVRFARDPIEYDFGKLRDARALRVGGPGWWDERVDAVFGEHLTPSVFLAHDAGEARRIARMVEDARGANPRSTIGSVTSIASFVPEDQPAKLAVIAQIRALATPETMKLLAPGQRAKVEAALPPAGLAPFGAADLPATLRTRLTEKDGAVGTPVLVYPAAAVDVWSGRDALRVARELRALPVPPGVPLASSLVVFADVIRAIVRDGPRATLLSLAGVIVLVLFAFGRGRLPAPTRYSGLVLGSLGVGVALFLGAAGALHQKLNMLNFIALPITFGIGADYATNVVQRFRADGARSIGGALVGTGGAVALCSLTTIIGYSSLLVARNQALRSFGVLADLGEVACLSAALVALPAWMAWRRRARVAREAA